MAMATSIVSPAPPTFPLDGSTADELYKYYAAAVPVIPAMVPATGFSDIEQQDLNFAWDQAVRVPNNNALADYSFALNTWKGQAGTIPAGPIPAPPNFKTLLVPIFQQLYLDWAAPGQPASAFNYSKSIVDAPLPPAPTIATVLPEPPDPSGSLFGLYVQGVWLATALAYAYVKDGFISVGQVFQFASSPTGYVKYVNGPFAGIPGMWKPCNKGVTP
jgi:hypothetical protein